MANSLQGSLTDLKKLQVLSKLGPSLVALVNSLPAVAKYAAIGLLLLNVRSWPLMWHVRVFRPVFALRFRWYWLRVRTVFTSKTLKDKIYQKWFEDLAPLGKNPFEVVTTYNTWTSIDDSDFNGHLSNSSYAKTNDSARFKMALDLFASFFRAEGWMALGATHYHFLREIPMFHKYEVRERIVGWDNKWIFIVGRFVSHPKSKGSKTKTIAPPPQSRGSDTPPSNSTFHASLRTPADGLQTPATPADPVIGETNGSDMGAATAAMNAIAAAQLASDELDGATLNCVVVSQLCFKHGRITVPPALVLAAAGFSAPAPEGTTPYSPENPPPHFAHAKELMSWASSRKYVELMRGGWRDVPEGQRWWIDALGGAVEERRKANVEGLNGGALGDGPMGLLRRGMEGAKAV
ncbi:hypothetical protein HWV62_27172 [Athelia sp. TMB]|nr:hypothetical protein HWV62_27172 [Athelia sp. TMB]